MHPIHSIKHIDLFVLLSLPRNRDVNRSFFEEKVELQQGIQLFGLKG